MSKILDRNALVISMILAVLVFFFYSKVTFILVSSQWYPAAFISGVLYTVFVKRNGFSLDLVGLALGGAIATFVGVMVIAAINIGLSGALSSLDEGFEMAIIGAIGGLVAGLVAKRI